MSGREFWDGDCLLQTGLQLCGLLELGTPLSGKALC